MASASVMYFPCFVFPYQRVPGLWYTPESVFTHTMPALFAGGAGAVEAVDFLEFERVFFGAFEFSAAAVPAAAVAEGFEAAAVFDFLEGFFAAVELSAVAVLSAASVFFDLVLLFEGFAFESLLP